MNQDEIVARDATPPHSVVMVEVNGQQYPMRSERKCKTCQSPYRLEIEKMICAGSSYLSVVSALEGRKSGRLGHPTSENLRHHIEKQHMPLGKTMVHALVRERSNELGRDMETYGSTLVDYVAANRAVIQLGMEGIASGELKPNISEMLAAIRMEHTVQQSLGDGLDAQAWQDAMLIYMEVAQRFIPPDRMGEYGRALATNPILRGIIAGEKRTIQGAIVNGPEED
jgi:hypothetical protein